MHFIDECIVELKAGNGGNGIVSWRREKFNPYGGPSGGDGGNGGNVVLVGDQNTNTLLHLRNHKIIQAEDGEKGYNRNQFGKNGLDKEVKVPLGSVIYDANTNKKITEILHHNQRYIICYGGLGGHGNAYFKTPANKVPSIYENGDVTEPLKVKIVIKYMADVGMVGLPNAGKSTLVGSVTSAKPKVANYQFTTLEPVLGICVYHHQKLVFADIPGLIEGASEGKGLGHEFLKHIERCSILLHVISLNPEDHEDILDAYQTIRNELKVYKKELLDKPIVLVGNKCDLPNADKQLAKLKKVLKKEKIFLISALNKTNLDELLNEVFKLDQIEKQKQAELLKNQKPIKVIKVQKEPDYESDIQIEKVDDHTWRATGQYLKYWTNRIPLTTADNIMRYNMKLKHVGIEEKIKKLGGVKNDTLLIYTNELVVE
ncbi:MAG: GTPase ObgE [Mycoplasma sp.]